MLSRRIVQSRTSNLDLDAPGCLGNIDRLDTHLTVDNVRFAPCAFLVAQDINISTGAWASRHDTSKILSVAGAGAAPTYGNATAIENVAVKYAAAKYHAAADTTWGQITTGDFAIEYIGKATVTTTIACSTGTTNGPEAYWTGSGFNFIMRDGTDAVIAAFNVAFAPGLLIHAIIFVDISQNYYCYVNGVNTNNAAATALNASMVGSALAVGARTGGSVPHDEALLSYAMWDLPTNPFPGALKNRTYFDRIARERFAIVAGIQDRRQGAHTFTRATPAYLDKWTPGASTKSLYRVSAGWPRICERDDANSKRVRRYLAEPQITNLCIQSEDLATTWTAHNLTTVSSNAAIAPNGETTADGVVGNATDTAHGVNQDLTLPATMHCFSTHAKPGDKDWIHLTTGITNVSGYFDVANGVVGTIGAAVTASGIEPHPYLNGYYRCWINFTGSADSKSYYLLSAQADGDNTFAGDTTTINTYFWGTQIEATAEHFPSSYIPTAAAAVARNKDELAYNVRLPIVGNINDLPQALTIGGTDYQPCAFLVADDVNVSTGAWASRHNATKALAYAGAGTNPTPQWDSVSRANKSIKYWASNYHQAADTTWGQVTSGDYAIEIIGRMTPTAGNTFLMSTYNGTTGIDIYTAANKLNQLTRGSGVKNNVTTVGTIQSGAIFHAFFGVDESVGTYAFVNGVYDTYTPATNTYSDSTGANLTVGALASDGSGPYGEGIVLLALWDLSANPWPGAATNQAVMAAIARARYNQLFRYPSCRLDCEILHPNVNRQAAANLVDAGVGANDRLTLGLAAADVLSSVGTANGSAQWSMAGSTDIAANVSRKLSVRARADSASADVDNASEATDAACEVPAGMTRVFVGEQLDGTIQPTCLVGGVKLFRGDK